jgi:hypothetical protein
MRAGTVKMSAGEKCSAYASGISRFLTASAPSPGANTETPRKKNALSPIKIALYY